MLSIQNRCDICLMAEKHPSWTQLQLAKWAYDAFHLKKIPSQGAISRLLAKKEVYMNAKEHEKNGIKIKKPTNLLVRRVLQEWISQSTWSGIPVTIPILQKAAESIWYKLPDEHREGDGTFSKGWIISCLEKMGLDKNMLGSELLKPPKVWTIEERAILKDRFSKISPKDIFTVDETLLAYDLPLDYAHYDTNGLTTNPNYVATVMLCSNLDGSEKLNPLVVGKYDSYVSFRNYFPDEPTDRVSESLLGQKMAYRFNISYHSNKKAWLTSSLLHDWLVSWGKRLAANGRKIYIVLDDSNSHRIINFQLKNIELIYTSFNAKFLPFNWGVLEEFKIRYRIYQYKALLYLQKCLFNDPTMKAYMTREQSRMTMSNAFKFISQAWNEITPETIQISWKRSGIIPTSAEYDHYNDFSKTFNHKIALYNELDELCGQYECERKWDSDLLINLNIETKNATFFSIDELVDCSVVEKCEKDPVSVVPQNTPENFTFTPTTIADIELATDSLTRTPSGSISKYRKPNPAGSNFKMDNFDLTLETLLNSAPSLPQERQCIVSNLIDKPLMFIEKSPQSLANSEERSFTPGFNFNSDFQDKSIVNDYEVSGLVKPPQDSISEKSSKHLSSGDSALVSTTSVLLNQTSLLSDIEVIKSLGNVLKLNDSNDISLSHETLDELRQQFYLALNKVRMIKTPFGTQHPNVSPMAHALKSEADFMLDNNLKPTSGSREPKIL